MRYILITLMMATMLFSAQQKQIILGSFSIESNALFYSVDAQKVIDEDAELKALMQKHSLKLEYKKVGDYNVVSICPFENYPSLFVTIAAVQKHYPKAYAINFPAFPANTQKVQYTEAEPKIDAPEPKEVVLEEETQEEVQEDVVDELETEIEAVNTQNSDIKFEPESMQKPMPMPAAIPMAEDEQMLSTDDLMLLGALLLIIIGFIIYKIKAKKEEEESE